MTLHVFRQGQGAVPLLLLHGIGSSGTAWGAVATRLGARFVCLAPDLPGYGLSPNAAEASLDAFADEMAALLDAEDRSRGARPGGTVAVGVSFGALLALALARRHPSRLRALVLADATLGRAAWPAPERAAWLAMRHDLAGSLTERAAERARELAAPAAPPAVIAELAAHMRRARPEGYRAVAAIIAATDAAPWLAEITQPALVLHGEHDRVTGEGPARLLAERLPRARLVRLGGVGHAPHVEAPVAFAAQIESFVAALQPQGTA